MVSSLYCITNIITLYYIDVLYAASLCWQSRTRACAGQVVLSYERCTCNFLEGYDMCAQGKLPSGCLLNKEAVACSLLRQQGA